MLKKSSLTKIKKGGNIAFKITYTDSNWSGVCSPDVAKYNFQHRTWCKIQSEFIENCQDKSFANPEKLDINFFPCHDCIALKELMFYAGHYHGDNHDNEPIRCLHAKVGKIALFSSREPGKPENERFIFAIGQMNYFKPVKDEKGYYEFFQCDKNTALFFDKDNYPKFWKYYRNANNPDKIAWNTGLFRYLDDKIILNVLDDITKSDAYSSEFKEKAKFLISKI